MMLGSGKRVAVALLPWLAFGCVAELEPLLPEVPMKTDDVRALPLDLPSGEPGLSLGMRPEPPPPSVAEAAPPASSEPLEPELTASLLAELGPRPVSAADFSLPPRSAPAPSVEPLPFSPPSPADPPSPDAAESGPLRVVRISPEGELQVAREVQIVFSKAMVPIGAAPREAARARLDPSPPGAWRWVDPQTLLFEPKLGRLPAATRFTVTVPAGVRSEDGAALPADRTVRLSTPPPRVERALPAEDTKDAPLRPVLLVRLDQRADPSAVLAAARLEVGGRPGPALRLARASDLERDRAAARFLDAGGPQAVGLVPEADLPAGEEVRFELQVGPWSAEGPRPAEAPFRRRFSTYGPLRVDRSSCGWGDNCRPGMPLSVRFSNRLAKVGQPEVAATLAPDRPEVRVRLSGRELVLTAPTEARTAYELTLNPEIRDAFGQRLGPTDPIRFEVEGVTPQLNGPDEEVVHRTVSAPTVSVHSAGASALTVLIHRVRPADWPAFNERDAPLPGEMVFSAPIPVDGPLDVVRTTEIDLGPALDGGVGMAAVTVEAPVGRKGRARRLRFWAVVSDVMLDAWSDGAAVHVWATDPAGTPLSGQPVQLSPGGPSGKTGSSGVVRLVLPGKPLSKHPWIEVGSGFLPEGQWGNGQGFVQSELRPRLTVHTVDDRGLYRPGERVHIAGWARRFDPENGLGALPPRTEIRYRATGPQGEVWAEGSGNGPVNASISPTSLGGFSLELPIPRDANLGWAQVAFEATRGEKKVRHVHRLQVAEFRRPRFEVSLDLEPGPHIVGQSLAATARASAYSTGALGGAKSRWQVTNAPTDFAPAGWDNFRFGRAPWWGWRGPGFLEDSGPVRTAEGTTDDDGRVRLVLEPTAVAEPFPRQLSVELEVLDDDRRGVGAKAAAVVHPAELAVGLRLPKVFLPSTAPLTAEVVVVDLGGERRSGKALLSLHRLDPMTPAEGPPVASATVSAEGPTRVQLGPAPPGRYQLRAEVRDRRGRTARTEATVVWAGDKEPASGASPSLDLSSDKARYAKRQVAVFTAKSPFPGARGQWLVVADGVLDVRPLVFEDGLAELRLPLTRRMVPNAGVEAWVVGPDGRFASGFIEVEVDPLADRLEVEVQAPPLARPSEEVELEVRVRDQAGLGVRGAEVTLAVVDEAVLDAGGSEWPDPLLALTPQRSTRTRSWHTRRSLASVEDEAGEIGARAMAMSPGGPGQDPAVRIRSDLRPLAHFVAHVPTDASGVAKIRFRLPDDLTRYRARAVAASPNGKALGQGEGTLVVTKPVSAELALPRFFTLGDRPELPLLVRNRTATPATVDVVMDAGPLELEGPAGRRVVVPPNSQVEVRFSAAVVRVETARVRARVRSSSSGGRVEGDAVEISVPVYPPVTMEAFAEHGSLEGQTIGRTVAIPAEAAPSVGGVRLDLSASRVLSAADGFAQILRSPYSGFEPRASRLLALWALHQVRDRLPSPCAEQSDAALAPSSECGWPDREAIEARAAEEIQALVEGQRSDGGWGYWPSAQRSDPLVTAHVVHALSSAPASRSPEVEDALDRGRRWLRSVASGSGASGRPAASGRPSASGRPGASSDDWAAGLPQSVRAALRAHAAWVLKDLDPQALDGILEQAGGPKRAPADVLAWLFGASLGHPKAAALRRALEARLTVTAASAHLVNAYDEGGQLVLAGSTRADAILLLALLETSPNDPLVDRLLAGLLAGRGPEGTWRSPHESAWALLAVARYAEKREARPPKFSADAWIGDHRAFEGRFEGWTAKGARVDVPMRWLIENPGPFALRHQGEGQLAYRIGLDFAPKSLRGEPASRGFSVTRRYVGLDDPSDVEAVEGGWRMRPGARVRVELEVVARGPRHHVALIDRLPAGLEPLHPVRDRLRSMDMAPDSLGAAVFAPGGGGWDHEQLRDTGSEAFMVLMRAGLHRVAYVARATTPGRFLAPPAHAEEMYTPETFGRTGTEVVTVGP